MKLASVAFEKIKQLNDVSNSRRTLMNSSKPTSDVEEEYNFNLADNPILINQIKTMAEERNTFLSKSQNESRAGTKMLSEKKKFLLSHSQSANLGLNSNENKSEPEDNGCGNPVAIANENQSHKLSSPIRRSSILNTCTDVSALKEPFSIKDYVSSNIFKQTTQLSNHDLYKDNSSQSTESSHCLNKPTFMSFSSGQISTKHNKSSNKNSKINVSSWSKEEKNSWSDDKKSITTSVLQRQKQAQYHRLVSKNGECNVTRANIKKRRQRYMADIFTTLVDIKWRWNLLNFVLAFILSWLIFALVWWLICFSHGDFDNYGNSGHKACVEEVYDFTTALLFSIETQQTIGFGSRRTNAHCPQAIILMMCQSCFGVIIQALMTGLVFAKLSRPKKRAETLLFSKNALICKRDDQLCLLFRVGDMRKSHIVEAHVKAIMIKRRITEEGEIIPLYQYDLVLGDNETEGRLFMVWPIIVEHKIDQNSPLWELSADSLKTELFELVVVLEGIVESTGMTTQARTSYLPSEILWGHRFDKLVTFHKESGQYFIDYSCFHSTTSIDMPECSAKEMSLHSSLYTKTSNYEEEDEDDDDDDGDDDDLEDEDQVTVSVKSDPLRKTNSMLFGRNFFAGDGQTKKPLNKKEKSSSIDECRKLLKEFSKDNFSNDNLHDEASFNGDAKKDTIEWLVTSIQQQHKQHQPPKQQHEHKHHQKHLSHKPNKINDRHKLSISQLPHKNYEDFLKRYSIPGMNHKNGVNSVALAAFDLQNDEQLNKSSLDLSSKCINDSSPFQFV